MLGEWQTETFVPPRAANGIVPRNKVLQHVLCDEMGGLVERRENVWIDSLLCDSPFVWACRSLRLVHAAIRDKPY